MILALFAFRLSAQRWSSFTRYRASSRWTSSEQTMDGRSPFADSSPSKRLQPGEAILSTWRRNRRA